MKALIKNSASDNESVMLFMTYLIILLDTSVLLMNMFFTIIMEPYIHEQGQYSNSDFNVRNALAVTSHNNSG
jgi:formate/nitrite transporter FocA (FNT family)